MRRITLIIADITGAILACGLSYMLFNGTTEYASTYHHLQLLGVFGFSAALCFFVFAYKGHYSWRTPWWQQVKQLGMMCVCAMLIDILVNYVAMPHLKGQVVLLFSWVFAIPCFLLCRLAGRGLLKKMNHWAIGTTLVGNPDNVIDTIVALKSEFYLTYNIHYVVLPGARADEIASFRATYPEIAVHDDLEPLHSHSMVILCLGQDNQGFVHEFLPRIRKAGAKFAIVPPTSGFSLYGMQPQYFFGYNIVLMESQHRLKTFTGRFLKQAFDRFMAFVGLVMLAPVFLFLMFMVRRDGGKAFYNQSRLGRNGTPFKCWKFRSMVTNADEVLKEILEKDPEARAEWDRDFKLKNDPRITKIGNFLRKSSLDEIPQLYNVLIGDMSIVGPRPIVKAEEVYYGDRMEHYLAVRPGITGLWQVSGRNDVTYEQRVALDTWYVENWSIWNDLVIIFKTSFVVLYRKGAY